MSRSSDVDASTDIAQREGMLRVRALSLEISAGPDTGRIVHVEGPTFIVGTGDGTDLRLTDPTVSREHLRIALSPQGVLVRDEGSKNGSWCAGMRITEVLLTQGIVLELGDTRLTLRIDAQPFDLPVSVRTYFGEAI